MKNVIIQTATSVFLQLKSDLKSWGKEDFQKGYPGLGCSRLSGDGHFFSLGINLRMCHRIRGCSFPLWKAGMILARFSGCVS